MANDCIVGDLVAEFLSQCGVTTAFGKAVAHQGPSLVEVDMNAVGEFPPYYPFNQRGA